MDDEHDTWGLDAELELAEKWEQDSAALLGPDPPEGGPLATMTASQYRKRSWYRPIMISHGK